MYRSFREIQIYNPRYRLLLEKSTLHSKANGYIFTRPSNLNWQLQKW